VRTRETKTRTKRGVVKESSGGSERLLGLLLAPPPLAATPPPCTWVSCRSPNEGDQGVFVVFSVLSVYVH
jgi:hypothetical protein